MTTVRWRTWLGFVSVATMLGTSPALANERAAHTLADKFAHDGDSAPPSPDMDRKALERKLDDDARLRADEAEMLERAKQEAAEDRSRRDQADRDRVADEARKASEKLADEKRLADEKGNTDREAQAAADLAAREAEAKRLAAEADRRAAEDRSQAEVAEDKAARERAAREAAQIKAAEAQRLAEARRLAEDKAKAERHEKETAEAARANEARLAEAQQAEARQAAAKKAEAQRAEAQQAEAQKHMEADREEEARRLSEKLARARELRAAKQGEGYSALGNPPPPEAAAPQATEALQSSPAVSVPLSSVAGRADEDIALAAPGETRATILLVMEPGTRGIRRYEKTGDPILCIGERCYIGNGVDEAATVMTRGRAFGPGNTLGPRAGACRHSLVCVFRDVEIGAGRFQIQPIDMRILRHDRRETVSVESDRTCTAVAGHLHCARGAQAASYRAWIVPESVARKAGAGALNAAISGGLAAPMAAGLQR